MSDRQNTNGEALSAAAEVASTDASQSVLKIRFLPKAIVFVGAVLTLSWFFEGWRRINTEPGIMGYVILVGGTVGTAFLLTLSAYRIYIEEKSRGALKRKIKLFDKIYGWRCNASPLQAKKEREIV